MNKPNAWELWYARVKYEDMEVYQDRPVLVIDVSDGLSDAQKFFACAWTIFGEKSVICILKILFR